MSLGEIVYWAIFVIIVAGIVIHEHFLPESPDEQLRRYYRGQKKRRERRGDTD